MAKDGAKVLRVKHPFLDALLLSEMIGLFNLLIGQRQDSCALRPVVREIGPFVNKSVHRLVHILVDLNEVSLFVERERLADFAGGHEVRSRAGPLILLTLDFGYLLAADALG